MPSVRWSAIQDRSVRADVNEGIWECAAALAGLRLIGDSRALPDVEGLLAIEHGPYRIPISSLLKGIGQRMLFKQAREIAEELRVRSNGAASP